MRAILTPLLALSFAAPARAEGDLKPVRALVEASVNQVLAILKEYYAGLEEKVEVKLHGAATGDAPKK